MHQMIFYQHTHTAFLEFFEFLLMSFFLLSKKSAIKRRLCFSRYNISQQFSSKDSLRIQDSLSYVPWLQQHTTHNRHQNHQQRLTLKTRLVLFLQLNRQQTFLSFLLYQQVCQFVRLHPRLNHARRSHFVITARMDGGRKVMMNDTSHLWFDQRNQQREDRRHLLPNSWGL